MGKKLFSRFNIFIFIIVIVTSTIVVKLVDLQIIKGEEYRVRSEKRLLRNMPIKAPRGEIFDRYGRPLVTNRQGYSIIFQREYITPKERLNPLILSVIKVMQQHNQSYIDTFPITFEAPYNFYLSNGKYSDVSTLEKEFKKEKKIPENATPTETIEFLADYYKVDDTYTLAEKRLIVGVRYEMENSVFTNNSPYTFATDVSIDVVTWLKEQHFEYEGVSVMTEYIRQTEGNIASHILGRVGKIYQEEYKELKDKNYGMNDIIGKDGMEKVLEDYLRGTDGISSIEQNVDGKMVNVISEKSAKPGDYAVLTLDAQLQQVLEESLERTIKEISKSPDSRDANAGSAVVVDVKSGEILAMASYPDFNLNTFDEDYAQLYKDPNKPMWNRAISGTYAPGSTFKMLSAVAALENDVVDVNTTIRDEGIYKYYKDYQPVCWIYADQHRTHGTVNVTKALEQSCNYYFYETGRQLGIDKLAEMGKKFGLGEYTGIEIGGESKGVFATPEYKEKTFNEQWYPGDTLQANIGQSYHLFTPLQLANYTATLANGGTRYSTHLLKEIKSYETAKSVKSTEIKVMDKVDMSDENYRAVMDGMRKVAETGTASNIFGNFHTKIGGKTGTASVSKGTATGVFVGFAPFDNPQIAMSVVVEHGAHGNTVAPIVRDVFDAYFGVNNVDDPVKQYNTLIP